MSKRIRSSDVQLGESFVVGNSFKLTTGQGFSDKPEISKEELYLQLKEKEFRQKLDQMLVEAQEKALSIIEEAKANAAKIIEEAEQKAKKQEEDLESIKNSALEAAKQEGTELGYYDGYKNASNEVYMKVMNIETVAESAFNIKKEIILSAEQEILQLSVVIAEKILKQQLEIKPELISEIIKAAVNELKDKEEIKIIINPALKDQLYNFSEELKAAVKGMKTVKIIEDKTIHINSAIVESPESRIDARLETQIAKISEELMKAYAEEPVLAEESVSTEVIKRSSKKKPKNISEDIS